MVKDYVHESRYGHSWSSCVRAYFLRYPNPNAQHVLSVDVLDRRIEYRPIRASEQSVPVLCTTRLILKRGNLPRWAPSGLMKNAESFVIEQSEVELDLFPARSTDNAEQSRRTRNGRTMRSWTRNLDHTTILAVTEGLVYKERFGTGGGGESSSMGSTWQSYCKTLTTAQIESQVSFGMLRRRIEKFGLARFVAHKDSSQQGILWTRSQLQGETAEQQPTREEQLQRSSIPRKKFELLESFQPPFLDGYPLGMWQKAKKWWYSGHYSQVKVLEDGYLIERDEDDRTRSAATAAAGDSDPEWFRGAQQEGPWAVISGRRGKCAVYSDHEWDADQGVVNSVRRRFGRPPQAIKPERQYDDAGSSRDGPALQALHRFITKFRSLLGYDPDNLSAKEETKDCLEVIDKKRTV